jgi:hypothetical protein
MAVQIHRRRLQIFKNSVRRALASRLIDWFAAFIFLLNSTPSTGSAWFFFYSSKPPQGLGFSSEFLGTINVVGSVFNLAGVVFFQAVCKRMPFRPILLWGTIISTVLGLSNLILVFHWNRKVLISPCMHVAIFSYSPYMGMQVGLS